MLDASPGTDRVVRHAADARPSTRLRSPSGRVARVVSESIVVNVWLANRSLWRIGLDGSERRLTPAPARYAGDSPRDAGKTLVFVRSHKGYGRLRQRLPRPPRVAVFGQALNDVSASRAASSA